MDHKSLGMHVYDVRKYLICPHTPDHKAATQRDEPCEDFTVSVQRAIWVNTCENDIKKIKDMLVPCSE